MASFSSSGDDVDGPLRPQENPDTRRSRSCALHGIPGETMKRLIFTSLAAALLGGCASIGSPVKIPSPANVDTSYVTDATKPDHYPGFLAAEGNIYSCRYGIHHESRAEFSPPKATIFASLLEQSLPGISTHHVVLQRFDVYENKRLKMLHNVGVIEGGYIGYRLAKAGLINRNLYTFKKLLIDADPMTKRDKNEHQVGCDDRDEGEYYSSEISGGHDVIVTWLVFSVDGKPYAFRSFYQYQPTAKNDVTAAIGDSIEQTIEAVAPRIAVQSK
ncbi:MAG: hypothetical protein ABI129_12405 [Rhodanobacter sp.]